MWPPRVLTGAGVAAVTALLASVYGTTVLGVDTEYALLWGEQLISGRGIDLDSPFAPTAHPLTVMAGAGAASLGNWSGGAMAVFSYLGYELAGLAMWRLAVAAFDRWVAAAAVSVFLLSVGMMRSALVSPNDMLYLAALLHAARAGIPDPRTGTSVLVPLAVAGLLRPEAWALVAAYLLFLWLDPERRRVAHLMALIAPASSWLLLGSIGANDPLFALTGTQRLRELAERPTGVIESFANLPLLSQEVLPHGVALMGLLGLLLSVRQRPGHVTWLASAGIACFLLFVVLMAAGFSMSSRYLVPTLAILALFAGATLAGWHAVNAGRTMWAISAAVCALVLGASALELADEYQRLEAWADREEAVWADLERILVASGHDDDCGVLTISGPLSWHGHVARLLDVRAGSLRDAMVHEPAPGLHVVPASHGNLSALRAGAPFATRDPRPPVGAVPLGHNASWAAWRVCPRQRWLPRAGA